MSYPKILLILIVVSLAGCAGAEPAQGPPPQPAEAEPEATGGMAGPILGSYTDEAAEFPKILFDDGEQVSLNDRCPVRKVKLNRKMPPVWINGRPVGFC